MEVIWLIIFLYDKLRNIEAMGFGDAKLMAAIGVLFGWKSIPFVLIFCLYFRSFNSSAIIN